MKAYSIEQIRNSFSSSDIKELQSLSIPELKQLGDDLRAIELRIEEAYEKYVLQEGGAK